MPLGQTKPFEEEEESATGVHLGRRASSERSNMPTMAVLPVEELRNSPYTSHVI
jgi:hypothetical protein